MTLIPKVRFASKELPQWIISSDRAAYHPWTNTIWLTWRGRPLETAVDFIHEMGHHALHVLGFQSPVHATYDRLWRLEKLRGR